MNAFIFPGQGCQKEGMGKDLYTLSPKAKEIFERANDYLGRKITDVMFNGSELELMETKNTQPSVFLYEVALALCQEEIKPDVVAGHSLGEFAALVVNGCLSFEDGLNLVLNRALIAQKVCEKYETTALIVLCFRLEQVGLHFKDGLEILHHRPLALLDALADTQQHRNRAFDLLVHHLLIHLAVGSRLLFRDFLGFRLTEGIKLRLLGFRHYDGLVLLFHNSNRFCC